MGLYDVGLVCLNGHEINARSYEMPEHNTKYCDKCGEPAIHECSKCGTPIHGQFRHDDPRKAILRSRWNIPQYCHECGTAYPWTERRRNALLAAIDELSELDEGDRGRLKDSVPDVIQETAKTQIAITRFKNAIAKAGAAGGKLLTDILSKVAAEIVVQALQIKG